MFPSGGSGSCIMPLTEQARRVFIPEEVLYNNVKLVKKKTKRKKAKGHAKAIWQRKHTRVAVQFPVPGNISLMIF